MYTSNGEKKSFFLRLRRDMKKNAAAYLLALPIILYYLIFAYKPMYGIIIAFKNYNPMLGIMKSPWARDYGLQYFISFFKSFYFGRVLKNTLTISLSGIIFVFPAPIIFALLLNELKSLKFKKVVQTISYLPHFISMVVVANLITIFTSERGIITYIMSLFGAERISLLSQPKYFVPVYIISDIWQGVGWGAIIYLAALAGVDQELYDAAKIDGAGRWKQTLHVTLPGISGTIIIMLLLNLGGILSVGFEKVFLLYNEATYETADVISTFVYRRGLESYQWSYSAAVGLFNTLINFFFIVLFNKISKKVTEISLW